MPWQASKIKYLLFPLALFYWGVLFWRNLFYTIGFFVTRRVPVIVVSIGNLTVGGTGKTPAVIYLARFLKKKGLNVVVVSRGYGRKTTGTIIVSDGHNIKAPWEKTGDEPYLMANSLEGIPIIVDETRYRGSMYAIKKYSAEVILLDDAFQHRNLERDIDIVLLNSKDPQSVYKLLPYGKLREPWFHLRRADIIFWTKTNISKPSPGIRNRVSETQVVNYLSKMCIREYLKNINGHPIPISMINGKKVSAFCGIGDPQSFEENLKSIGAKIVTFNSFNDHHVYTKTDIANILEVAEGCKADYLITTDKDMVKMKGLVPNDAPLYSLGIKFIPAKEGEDKLWLLIRDKMKKMYGL